MSQPYVGEIRMFGGNFAPVNWAFCDGALLLISQNETLFALIGTTYGGDGQQTFALPDLRGRLPVHQGNAGIIGQTGGVEQIALTAANVPSHTHTVYSVSRDGDSRTPGGAVLAGSGAAPVYSNAAPNVSLASGAVGSAAGSASPTAHDNIQPYLCVNFIISLFGVFPSQT